MIKHPLNTDLIFSFDAVEPLQSSPVLSLGGLSITLNPIRSSYQINSIANDRRTLTTVNQNDVLLRSQVNVFIIAKNQFYSTQIASIDGVTTVLSDALPNQLVIDFTSKIEFAKYTTLIQTNSIIAISQTLPFQVNYTTAGGVSSTEKGLIKITPRPFNTGLTHDSLIDRLPQLVGFIPRRQNDFLNQIKKAQKELEIILRNELQPLGLSEDEIFDGSEFEIPHTYLSSALIYEGVNQFDLAMQYRERAYSLVSSSLRAVYLDTNKDGLISIDEMRKRITGGNKRDFKISSYELTDDDKFFNPKRDMRH